MKVFVMLLALTAWIQPVNAAPTYLSCQMWRTTESGRRKPLKWNFTLNESTGTLTAYRPHNQAETASVLQAAFTSSKITAVQKYEKSTIEVIYSIDRITGAVTRETIWDSSTSTIANGFCDVVQAPTRVF